MALWMRSSAAIRQRVHKYRMRYVDIVNENLFSRYDTKGSHDLLVERGWEHSYYNTYKHPDAPRYTIDLDIHNVEGKGPFTLFHGNVKIAQLRFPPYASHLMLHDQQPKKSLDQPRRNDI